MEADHDHPDSGSIAIVGIAGHFPGARTASELWAMLREGREATQWMTDSELRAAGVSADQLEDPAYVRASLVLPDMEMFDAGFFGFSKRDAAVLDPQHRHFLECAWEALEDAGHMPESFEGAIGVFGGCGMQAYLPYNLMTNPELVKSMGLFLLRHTGNDKDFLTSRVSYLLNLKGPSLSIQTACSTSLVAVHVASQSLLSGECDMALAGGASIELPHRQGYLYAPGEILSPDGHCRAFDAKASGTVFGSGAAIVVLRRLADAVRDRDNIYAVIRGSAVNNDGNQKAGYLAPSVDGQARAAVEALAVSGVDAASVSYIEAHGTGTPVGDPIEVAALAQAYGSVQGTCGIGSLKTNIGHLDTAAGVASLIKVSLALRHGLIPATLNFTQPNGSLELAKTPFYVMNQAKPWARGISPRLAAVNSLGVGGTNAHVIVEEAPLPSPLPLSATQGHDGQWQMFTLSARTATSLEGLKAKWRNFLQRPAPDFSLADAAYTTQVGRRMFEHRCAVVVRDLEGLRTALESKSTGRCVGGETSADKPAIVMMFPGGGAHFPGAGRELLEHSAFRRAVDECFNLMPPDAPGDLRQVMFALDPSSADAARKLEQPGYAIPALFTLEYSLAKLWQSWGVVPVAVMGHSAGEYAAACFAGVMSLEDALAITVLRGQLFEAVPPGAMLAVDLPEADLREQLAGTDLDLAAVNAPDLCIASGALHEIAVLEERLAGQGVENRRLRIDVAAHSHLLDGVLETFRQRLSKVRFHAPTIPFISNLTGTWVEARTLVDPEYWVRHLRHAVRFSDGMARALEMPGVTLLEVGPGQSLCGLARQNGASRKIAVLPSTSRANDSGGDLAIMMMSAGALWTRGTPLLWNGLNNGAYARRTTIPTYAFDHERHWIEPGRGVPGQGPSAAEESIQDSISIKRLASYEDWFLVPRWNPAPKLPHSAASRGQRWLVFGNHSKLTADVLAQAAAQAGSVVLVHTGEEFARLADGSFTLSPDDPAHFRRLFEFLDESASLPDQIVHLWSLESVQGRGNDVLSGRALAFDSVLNVGKALACLDSSQAVHLTVVAAGSQAVQVDDKVPHPERALALGPCRVIPREVLNVSTRMLDLSPVDISSTAVSRCIVAESLAVSGPDLIAYRGGERFMLALGRADRSADADVSGKLREGGAYLITGGLGDIALDLASFLAVTHKARLALVSRRVLPAKTEWLRIAASGDASAAARVIRRLVACENAGGQVVVFSADVSDARAMASVVSSCRAHFGTIHGVFHAAGVLEDGPIATKTPESIRRVLAAKAGGAQVLHELLPPGDLDFFAMFSSTSVHLAAAGQADYLAANAFIASLAASRADGLCIHWGIWGGQGMALRAHEDAGISRQHDNTGHPFLGLQVSHEDGAVFEATYCAAELWALQEHAVGGRPVLPGTAYIEIARAAMTVLHPGSAIEIRALSFEEAMVFGGESTRLVRTEMRRSAAGYDMVVRSCGMLGEPWVDHARAGVSLFNDSLPPALPLASSATGEWLDGAIPQERAVAFGARWRNIVRMQLGEHAAVAEMELPGRFSADLVDYAIHPAIADMAATFGLHLITESERDGHLFVPLSIDRIRLVAPLPQQSVSRVKLTGDYLNRAVSFDVSLHDIEGHPIATFEGFSLRAVKPEAVSHQARTGAVREQTLMESMLACGIRSEDSHALFARLLSDDHRDVVVSSIALDDLRRAIEKASSRTVVPTPARAELRSGDGQGDADFNPVERVIADAWRELLGVDAIARADDFFALGGHSLAAVRLFARIRKQFAVDLPLATLFQASTLGELSRVVCESGGIDTSQAAAVLKKISSSASGLVKPAWSPLVALCKGQADRLPVFCVHGAGGNVLNFKIISDRLGRQQPFYGLQAQGVDGRLPALTTIEAMATQYVEAIRTVHPNGPYQLAGYSGGGLIAMEMAQQLKKDGAQVSLVAMIDTLAPSAAGRKISVLRKLWLMRHWSMKFALAWPERRRSARVSRALGRLALEKLANGETLTPELIEPHLYQSFVSAQARYVPTPYEGKVVIYRANQCYTPYIHAGPTLGWKEHVLGEIRFVEIDGSHVTMMSDPGLSVLIEHFRSELALPDEKLVMSP